MAAQRIQLRYVILLASLTGVFGNQRASGQDQVPAPPSAQSESAPPANQQASPARTLPPRPAKPAQGSLKARAWQTLTDAIASNSAEKQAKAISALGMLPGDIQARKLAEHALTSDKAIVRGAAATALGSMNAVASRTLLQAALDDDDPTVVLAAANSLLLLNDESGYDVYYAVLTGDRKATQGLVKTQLATLRDKKKMAMIGLDEGIGFIPFAGIPYTALKMVLKDDSSGVRAAAARRLAHDPDPSSGEALINALSEKNWVLRSAALEALAQRGDRSLLGRIALSMDDDKDEVRYRAAACVIRLSASTPKKKAGRTSGK